MQDEKMAFQKEVKKALTHLDDLAYLGNCSLAHSLLPDKFLSPEERGKLLRQALQEAIEHLQPPGTSLEDDCKQRLYRVLYYRYIEGLSRQEVMGKLAIGYVTFHRDQGKAIAAVCDYIKRLSPPPSSARPIPRIKHFVGREQELAAYRRGLEQDGFTVIAGPPGAGKTALGAELAARWEDEGGRRVIWVTLHNGRNTTLEALLETIALALAAHGQPAFWRFLQTERRKEAPLSPEGRVRYLLTLLEAGGYLLCLDDYHLVNDNPAIHALCADLLQSARQGRLKLLVMSRTAPRSLGSAADWLVREQIEPLGGLGRPDTRRLLEACGLPALPEAVFAELYARTGGLPIFLKLFAAWAHGHELEDMASEKVRQKLALFAENMVKEQIFGSYLLHQVYESLSPQELRLLTCAAAFRIPFDTEDPPIIALLKAEGVQDVETTWMALAERYIFTPLEGQGTIVLHPLVRAYFAQRLRHSPDEQARLHRQIGEYYEQHVGDTLEAGYHYREAGNSERAARVLAGNVSRLINAGQAELALEQLERLAPHLTPPPLTSPPQAGGTEGGAALSFEVAAACEALCHLLGQREKQRSALETLLALAAELNDGRRRAMACNRQARFHEAVGEYAAAITAAEAGQAAARRAGDKVAEVESLNRWGVALKQRGDYAAARERSEQALSMAREIGDRWGEARGLSNLGTICCGLSDYAPAQNFCWQALTLCHELGDRQGETLNLNIMGIICHELGDHAAALDFHERALTIRRAISDLRGQATSLVNLGTVHRWLGNHAAAWTCYEQAISLCRAIGDRQKEMLGLINLGVTCQDLGDYAVAQSHYEQALTLCRAVGDRQGEADSLCNLGLVCCNLGDYATAQVYSEQTLTLYRNIGDRSGASYALTYLGMALEGRGDLDGAEVAYREALAIRREIGQAAVAIEDVAGLARVQAARLVLSEAEGGKMEEARQYADECMAHIAAHGVTGIEYPFEVYLTCVRVLEACGDAYAERAQAVLEEAHALLVQRTDKIGDESLRRSYLENVPANREVMRRWGNLHPVPMLTEPTPGMGNLKPSFDISASPNRVP